MPLQVATVDGILSDEAVAARCHVTPRIVRRWRTTGPSERRLGYVETATGEIFTTEAMLASFVAANLKSPPRSLPRTSILENDVREKAFQLLEALVRTGHVRVTDRCPVSIRQDEPPEAA